MPVWQRVLKEYVDDGSLAVLGVIQEQHAERCRLYAQWKNLTFPIVQDQLNSNGLAVVPVVIFIDENGIVRNTRPRPNHLQDFAEASFPIPDESELVDDESTGKKIAAAKITAADELMRWQQPTGIDRAIATYESALANFDDVQNDREITKGQLFFRLGVAYRARFDAASGMEKIEANDFEKASKYWSKALAEDPNQYIWRRRIQQYGPRLEKPYPFYDWIETAQREIRQRGDQPVEMKIALTGSELAQPAKELASVSASAVNPDPDANVTVDDEGLIQVSGTVVPRTMRAGKTARVHLLFVPVKGLWNNESEPMKIWIASSDQVEIVDPLIEVPNDSSATSSDPRTVEFELKASKGAHGLVQIAGYALYGTCTKTNDQCLYRRLPFQIDVEITK